MTENDVLNSLCEKYFFEIFEHIQTRKGHTHLKIKEFWADFRLQKEYNSLRDIKNHAGMTFVVHVNNYCIIFQPTKIIERANYSINVHMMNKETFDIGMKAFDNNEYNFNHWLKSEIPALGNRIPRQLLDTTEGEELVKNELIRIDWSVY